MFLLRNKKKYLSVFLNTLSYLELWYLFQKQQKSGNKAGNQQEKGEVKYFCDTCDRGYKDEDKYREHVDGHEKV